MATTTNYGWTTPDDTALVKDGASAIRTLGSSIDTTTKNLNPETTLGDISYRSSTANVNTRLALGTASQQLRVNAGATAPEWFTPAAAGGMTLLSTTTLSGASTTISSINQTYTNLLLVLDSVRTSADQPTIKLSYNGTTGAAEYMQTVIKQEGTSLSALSSEVASVTIGEGTSESATAYRYLGRGQIQVLNYSLAVNGYTFFNFASNNGGGSNNFLGTFSRQSTTAISSIKFEVDSGTFSAGNVYLYGVK